MDTRRSGTHSSTGGGDPDTGEAVAAAAGAAAAAADWAEGMTSSIADLNGLEYIFLSPKLFVHCASAANRTSGEMGCRGRGGKAVGVR